MRRNSIEWIGSKNLDLSLTRMFRIAGAETVELRPEAFNAMNWFQWLQPGQTAGDPPIMQFALKYGF